VVAVGHGDAVTPLLKQLPNCLSALRVCAAPLTALFILHGQDWGALGVFAFAGLSDALDGYLARRLASDSRFGLFLDPAADKLLMLASFVTLTVVGAVPLWLTAVVILRDVAIVGCVAAAWLFAIPVRIEPLQIGKISTAVQVCFIGAVLLLRALDLDQPSAVLAGAIATGAVTIASWLAYGQLWFRALMLGRRTA
jgi:cardiolipin synthase